MNVRRNLPLRAAVRATMRAALWATLSATSWAPVVAQPAPGRADALAQGGPIPDFSGIWRHGSLPWFIPPASGPGPVTNRMRRRDNGASDYGRLVGDYTNPILQRWAADAVKRKGDISLS